MLWLTSGASRVQVWERGRVVFDEGACLAWFLQGDTCRGCAPLPEGRFLDASATC
jgi:hypothetical protein